MFTRDFHACFISDVKIHSCNKKIDGNSLGKFLTQVGVRNRKIDHGLLCLRITVESDASLVSLQLAKFYDLVSIVFFLQYNYSVRQIRYFENENN